MTTIHPRPSHSALVAMTCTLAACAGTPVNTAIRPAPASFRAAPSMAHSATTFARGVGASDLEIAARGYRYSSMEEMLTGRFPGLDVLRNGDGTISLRVRGPQTGVGFADPLVVVDGMMVSGSQSAYLLASLAPRDVRNVEVLRDAGATAVYGSRGSGGVVVISTNRAW